MQTFFASRLPSSAQAPPGFFRAGNVSADDTTVKPSSPLFRIVACTIATLLSSGCVIQQGAVRVSTAPIDLQTVPIVHGLNGKHRTNIALTSEQLDRLRAAFSPRPTNPWEERQSVRHAVAQFEQLAAEQSPIGSDRPLNALAQPIAGQVDCVGEATNTTVALLLLQQRGLLRFHAVMQPSFRAPFLVNPHNSARLRESETGHEFVIDSWFRSNGELPLVQRVETWRRMHKFPQEENPDLG